MTRETLARIHAEITGPRGEHNATTGAHLFDWRGHPPEQMWCHGCHADIIPEGQEIWYENHHWWCAWRCMRTHCAYCQATLDGAVTTARGSNMVWCDDRCRAAWVESETDRLLELMALDTE